MQGEARNTMNAITQIPDKSAIARFKPEFGTRFIVTVDTEEEFAWDEPLQRDGHTLNHVARIKEFQNFCESEEVVPVYLTDYPIATSALAAAVLKEPVAAGKAEIGIHLHPWVTPPDEEVVNERNSFAGNLPAELEEAKFDRMRDAIARNFGIEPRIFRAGRYGAGESTAAILGRNGIAIDSSVRARFDYSKGGGPDFARFPARPYWVGEDRSILELPLTTVYAGRLGRYGDKIYPRLRIARLRSVLARLGLVERIPLTPEGTSVREAIRAIDRAAKERLPLLVFSFHSPSLDPGHTPYVNDEKDLEKFYGWWRAVFAHCRRKGMAATDLSGIMEGVEL